jgi:hypothetical protein
MQGIKYTEEEIEEIFGNYVGGDASFDVNIYDSYIMGDYPLVFDRTQDIDVVKFFYDTDGEEDDKITCIISNSVSFDELQEIYRDNLDPIESCSETSKHVDFINPGFYDFLNLASDCEAWLYT